MKIGIVVAFDAILQRCVRVLNGIGLLSLVVLALVTVTDVIGRYLFNRPLLGALELSELLMVFLAFACFAYTELHNGHVEIDMLVNRFSPRGRALCEGFAALLSTGLWGAIAWRTALQAKKVYAMGETTSNLLLPVSPFIWTAAVGSAAFALVLLVRMLKALRRVGQP
jgi:TRAP-type C4-dicarboxylate transport system permease small subunit